MEGVEIASKNGMDMFPGCTKEIKADMPFIILENL